MSMSDPAFPDALKQLLEEFTRSGIRELHVRKPGFELFLSTDPAASAARTALISTSVAATGAPALAASAPAPGQVQPSSPTGPGLAGGAAALPEGAIVITAPNLGTFYRAPKPGAANYVEVGSKVKAGDELCLIEVMKLFTALRAEQGGMIHSVLVEDGAMVEGGQPLFALVKD
jgi:acetyl-CoA carboxylase biotin carboxyl carrier protein